MHPHSTVPVKLSLRKALHVLVVEDSESDHDLLVHMLGQSGFNVSSLRVETPETMQAALLDKTWDVVISDCTMPRFDGLSALELFKNKGQDQPFIVVSGIMQKDFAVVMVKAGAHDFVRKDDMTRLVPVLEHELNQARQRQLSRLAADEVRESQLQLKQALDASGLAAFSWDVLTGEIWRDARYDQIFGYTTSPATFDFETLMGHIVPEERETIREELIKALTKGDFETKCTVIRADRSPAVISLRGKVIYDDDGKPGRTVGIIMDITARERTSERLIETEARLETVTENMTEGLILSDPNGQLLSWNRAAQKMHGCYREKDLHLQQSELTTIFELFTINGTVLPMEQWPLSRVLRNETVDNLEVMVQRIGSKWKRLLSYSGALVREPSGKQVAFLTVNDITDRKKNEAQIVEQAAFLDKAQDAIIARDLQGEILFWNKGAERMYGWSRGEVLGRNVAQILYANPKTVEDLTDATFVQGEWQGELLHLTKDQREIIVEARFTLVRDSDGRPKSVLAIYTDITEKKKIEIQFLRAQRMESIGTLAGGIAHDLNNILSPIMMATDILKTISVDPQAKSILKTIEVSAKRGADIVRQVLSFARGLESKRIEIQPNLLLKELEDIIKETFPKNINLQFTVSEETWKLWGDPTQVHQILLNLCLNARDALPHGGNLGIAIENCELDKHHAAMNVNAKPGRYVKICVTDSGTGMPPALLNKIFEPFFTTKPINKGTGLGLSTVMAIVKSHEGAINVYSEPGRGTTFNIYLPAAELSATGDSDPTINFDLPRGDGETVLVVDDEASIVTITSQTLQAFGYRVLTAMDGAEAVALYTLHRKEIAVVLTDMMMPVMDGTATIHALRRINPEIKLIAASGLNAPTNTPDAFGISAKYFLAKPYTAKALLKVLRAVLDDL